LAYKGIKKITYSTIKCNIAIVQFFNKQEVTSNLHFRHNIIKKVGHASLNNTVSFPIDSEILNK